MYYCETVRTIRKSKKRKITSRGAVGNREGEPDRPIAARAPSGFASHGGNLNAAIQTRKGCVACFACFKDHLPISLSFFLLLLFSVLSCPARLEISSGCLATSHT